MQDGRPKEGTERSVIQAQIVFVNDFITHEEHQVLHKWALEMVPLLRPNGPQRAYLRTEYLPWLPAEYTLIRKRIECKLQIGTARREPDHGLFLGSISNGGAVHEHVDRAPANSRHLRCNLFIQLPVSGGEPVIQNTPQPYRERMLLCFFPNEQPHRCQPVKGTRQRLMCSFGYLVPLQYRLPDIGNCELGA